MPWGSKKRGGSGWGSGSEERESVARFILGGIQEFVRGGVLRYGKTTPGSTSRGFWLGVDQADGLPKFHFGKVSSGVYFDGDSTTFTGDGGGITNIDGGNIQTGTVTADQINVDNLEAVSVNTGDLSVTGTLLMDGAASLLKGNDGAADQWYLNKLGLTFLQPVEDENAILFKGGGGEDIGWFGVSHLTDGGANAADGLLKAIAPATSGDVVLLMESQGFTDGDVTYSGILFDAPAETRPRVLVRVGSGAGSEDTKAEFQIYHYTGLSSLTPLAGFGVLLRLMAKSATVGSRDLGGIAAAWDVATDASRAASVELQAADSTGLRTGVKVKATGSAVQIGFLGATPAARQAHIADPSGGGTVDTEARSAINSILAALETFGLVATS